MLTNEDIEVPKKLIIQYYVVELSLANSRPSFSAQLSAEKTDKL